MYLVAFLVFAVSVREAWGKYNFLVIIADDLRTTLGCYGDRNAYTPNMDYLAKDGVIFSAAYAQQALCAPSRNSFLTSRRPDTLKLYDFYSYWRDTAGNFTTLPQYLKENGYITASIGKVFHPGISSNNSDDSPYSWTEKPFHPYTNRYKNAPVCRVNSISPKRNLICPVDVSLMPNGTLPDIEILKKAKAFVRDRSKDSKPFFLAVGFQKPHIPLKYPEKYLNYHPLQKFDVPNPYKWPQNVSNVAYNPWTDLRERDDVKALKLNFPWEKIPVDFSKRTIQSYYAAVSYIDDMIGKLLKELNSSLIRKNTVVILMSDHGWSLGEHAEWSKYSNFDVAIRVPLIISIPGVTFGTANYSKGKTCSIVNDPVELVDIFPTIADIAKIPIPICSKTVKHTPMTSNLPNPCSEGITLFPLINAAIRCQTIPWKKAAFSQYPRPSIEPSLKPNSDKPRLNEIKIMGYTLKTHRYRYTAWIPFSRKTRKPDWNTIIAEELYDHRIDQAEISNVATSSKLSKIKSSLRQLLQKGWRNVLPKFRGLNTSIFAASNKTCISNTIV